MAFIVTSIFFFIIWMSWVELCTLRWFLFPTGDYCPPIHLVCYRCYFLPDPPSSNDPHQEMTTVLLIVVPFVALVFWASLLPLVQLLLQLLVALGKSFDCCRQGLHLSFQGVRGIPCLLVDGSHRTRLDHATLYLRSSDTANHLFPQMVSTDGYLKKGKTRTK